MLLVLKNADAATIRIEQFTNDAMISEMHESVFDIFMIWEVDNVVGVMEYGVSVEQRCFTR